jgi:hypothetical protein
VGRDRTEAGISGLGAIVGLAALVVVLLVVSIVVAATLPSPTTTTTTITTTSAAGHGPSTTTTAPASTSAAGGSSVVAACRSDVSDVQTALAAYQASNGSYPSPPADWSAGAYPTNFAPLTNAPPPGPFLKMPPGDNHYVIMWDSSGRIWVEGPGTFSPTYDAANDGANPSTCTRVAR